MKDLIQLAAVAGLVAQTPNPDPWDSRAAAAYYIMTIIGIIALFFL